MFSNIVGCCSWLADGRSGNLSMRTRLEQQQPFRLHSPNSEQNSRHSNEFVVVQWMRALISITTAIFENSICVNFRRICFYFPLILLSFIFILVSVSRATIRNELVRLAVSTNLHNDPSFLIIKHTHTRIESSRFFTADNWMILLWIDWENIQK